MQGRPKLFTSYETDSSIFPTSMQRWIAAAGIALLFMLPFDIPFFTGPVADVFPTVGRSSAGATRSSDRSQSLETGSRSFDSSAIATGFGR